MQLKKWFVIAAALFVLVNSRVASANTMVYLLTSDHCTGGCGTAPFGSVTVSNNASGGVDFSVALAAGYTWASTGAGDGMMFKFNGTGVSLSDITVTSTPYGTENLSAYFKDCLTMANCFNGDGTGNFRFGIGCLPLSDCNGAGQGGQPPYVGPLTFTVANASLADVTGQNNLGQVFVADVLAPNGNTGPVDASTPQPTVPDGGMTMSLLGMAMAGLGVIARRRK